MAHELQVWLPKLLDLKLKLTVFFFFAGRTVPDFNQRLFNLLLCLEFLNGRVTVSHPTVGKPVHNQEVFQ